MGWEHINGVPSLARSKPLPGYRIISSDRGVSKDNQLGIVVGDALKLKIRKAAKANRRNMSEEVISILTWYYGEFGGGVVNGRKGE